MVQSPSHRRHETSARFFDLIQAVTMFPCSPMLFCNVASISAISSHSDAESFVIRIWLTIALPPKRLCSPSYDTLNIWSHDSDARVDFVCYRMFSAGIAARPEFCSGPSELKPRGGDLPSDNSNWRTEPLPSSHISTFCS